MRRQKKEGIARWAMRKRAYVGALRLQGDHLMLIVLRHTEEVVQPSDIAVPSGREANPKELKMAQQLVSILVDRFDPSAYHDEQRERVLELIRRKTQGEEIELPPVQEKRAARSLAEALEGSLAIAGRRAGSDRKQRTVHA